MVSNVKFVVCYNSVLSTYQDNIPLSPSIEKGHIIWKLITNTCVNLCKEEDC